jgi:hypothetical protein
VATEHSADLAVVSGHREHSPQRRPRVGGAAPGPVPSCRPRRRRHRARVETLAVLVDVELSIATLWSGSQSRPGVRGQRSPSTRNRSRCTRCAATPRVRRRA